MAIATKPLTLGEFEAQYAGAKPYYEFWAGEAIQKSRPTWVHGLLQSILLRLLHIAGYKTASEIKFKIDSDLQFIPDVVATKGIIHGAYPTQPIEIVVEILSEADPMSRLLTKCRSLSEMGHRANLRHRSVCAPRLSVDRTRPGRSGNHRQPSHNGNLGRLRRRP